MITKRVNEIVDSPKKIEVLYKQQPVWLHHMDENSRLVKVKILGEDMEMEVPVADLKESGDTLEQ